MDASNPKIIAARTPVYIVAFHQVSFVNNEEILKAELAKALAECEHLREEKARLRLRIGEDLESGHQDIERPSSSDEVKAYASAAVTIDSPPEVKVSLFKDLFRGRDDVYAIRWKEGTVNRAIRQRATRNGTRRLLLVEDRRNHFASRSYSH